MTSDRDIERVLDHWFTERPTQVADRVLDGVADQIARQHQRPAWRLQWRPFEMNSAIKIGAAIAAVLILAVAGWNLLPGSSTGVGDATSSPPPTGSASPSPAASASPSVAPSASVVFPSWYTEGGSGAGILSAGNHTTRSFTPGFSFTTSMGWVNSGDDPGYFGLFPDTPANAAEYAASEGLANSISIGPHTSPYFLCDAWEDNSGGTATEIAAAMGENEALATSEPVGVTIGGLTGHQIDVRLDPAWTETCPGDPPDSDLGDLRTRAILLDTADRRVIVIFIGSLHSDGHEAFLAEAMPIVESFQFDLTP